MDYTFKDFIELYQKLNNSEWITVFEENPTKNYEIVNAEPMTALNN